MLVRTLIATTVWIALLPAVGALLGAPVPTTPSLRIRPQESEHDLNAAQGPLRNDGRNDSPDQYIQLADSMREHRERRNNAFLTGMQPFARIGRSTDPWYKTLLLWEGRGFGRVLYPWLFINLFSVVWTIVTELGVLDVELQHLQLAHTLLLPTLGMFLAFRMNRAAVRFWESRKFWGLIIAAARNTAGLVITHLSHSQKEREACLAWTCAFCVGVKLLLRRADPSSSDDADAGIADQLAGVLGTSETQSLLRAWHPGLLAAQRIRAAAHRALDPQSAARPAECGPYDAVAMKCIHEQVDELVRMMGGCERVQGTPLPLVYVSHLRTCLLVAMLGLPPLLQESMGWTAIPVVAVISFAFLGTDAVAAECEVPFSANIPNHLNMDAYCMRLIEQIHGMAADAAESLQPPHEG